MNRRSLIESMGEDPELAACGLKANLVYDRLITITDDAGLAPGEAEVIKGRCFPMLEEMRVADVRDAIERLVEKKLLYRTVHNGRAILLFKPSSFQHIQKLRRDYKRRFNYGELSQLVWEKGLHGFRTNPCGVCTDSVGIGASVTVTVPVSVSVSNTSPNGEVCAELPDAAGSAPPVPPDPSTGLELRELGERLVVMTFPLKGRGASEWHLREDKLDEYRHSFPGVDVLAECRKARQWCIDNPKKQKTANGIKGFLSRWLGRAQDRAANLFGSAGPLTQNQDDQQFAEKFAAKVKARQAC